MTEKRQVFSKEMDISIIATLLRTVCLTGLTLFFMAIIRFWPSASHQMQRVAGSAAWQHLYGWLHIETALGREQLLLVGIVLVCFSLALIGQALCLVVIIPLVRRSVAALRQGRDQTEP